MYSGNLGWDLACDTSGVFENNENLKLQPNDLFKKVVDNDGSYRLYLCTGRFVFEKGVKFKNIADNELKTYIQQAAVSSTLSTRCQQYLYDLVDKDNVEVYAMPDGLPYNVDQQLQSASHSASSSS